MGPILSQCPAQFFHEAAIPLVSKKTQTMYQKSHTVGKWWRSSGPRDHPGLEKRSTADSAWGLKNGASGQISSL